MHKVYSSDGRQTEWQPETECRVVRAMPVCVMMASLRGRGARVEGARDKGARNEGARAQA